jgi:hypothetical protein
VRPFKRKTLALKIALEYREKDGLRFDLSLGGSNLEEAVCLLNDHIIQGNFFIRNWFQVPFMCV